MQTKIKYARQNKNKKKKQNKNKNKTRNKTIYLKEGGDRKDGTHVGATSPSLGVCTPCW